MRIVAVLAFVFMSFCFGISFAQELPTEMKDGKLYRVHVVEAGNTLYGIHIKYDVSVDELIEINPTAKDGLQIGQKIYIPLAEVESNVNLLPGINYEIHIVKRKETLYGLAKSHGCTVQDILDLNPGADEGIKAGQELKIPVKKEVIQVVDNGEKQPSKESTDNTVKPVEDNKGEIVEINTNEQDNTPKEEGKDETLYPSNPFSGVKDPFDNLDDDDNGIEDVIPEDTTPRYEVEFKDSVIRYEVQKGETLYSISKRYMVPVETLVEVNNIKGNSIKPGQVLIIPLKREDIKEIEIKEIIPSLIDTSVIDRPTLISPKDNYNILIALPLKTYSNTRILSGLYDDRDRLNNYTDLSVSFLMGAEMALDTLEKLGLKANVEFYDTEGNMDKMKERLGTNNPNNYDLIIGPFYKDLMTHTAAWGKTNRVPVVAVTKVPNSILYNNPFALSTITSDDALIEGLAKYLAINHPDDNFVILEGENNATKERIEIFKKAFHKNLPAGKSARIQMSTTGGATGSALAGKIQAKDRNYVICLSDNVSQVMNFVNALNAAKNNNHKKTDIVMVGLNEWLKFPTFNSYYRNRFTFHFASANHLDYDESKTATFTAAFRKRFGSDPSRYAIHGYDVVLTQIAHLILGYKIENGLMDSFDLRAVSPEHGKENTKVFITRQVEFEYELLDVISK